MDQEQEYTEQSGDVAEVTATAETTEQDTAQETAQQPEPSQETKTFSQEELDQIIEKRLAKERRRLARQQQPQQRQEQPPLDPQQFDSPEAYAEALAEQKAEQKLRQKLHGEEQNRVNRDYSTKCKEFAKATPDFEQVAHNPALPISDLMAEVIKRSDVGPELAYHLGKDEDEIERIAALPPLLQARELGRIEAKIIAEKEKPKVSNAPPPINPVGKNGSGVKPLWETDQEDFDKRRREYKQARR